MKTLIVYYSNTQATELIAKVLAHHLKADIIEIQDLKSRNDRLKSKITSSIDAFRENKTEIYPPSINTDEYDTIYIGTPVWAGNPTPAIVTIIDSCNLRGKDVIVFATMSKQGGNATIDRLSEKIKARGGRVIESFTIKTKDKSPEELIHATETIMDILDLQIYK